MILMCDDDRMVTDVLVEALRNNGYEAEAAYGGQEAIDRLVAGPKIDLLLLDLRMPPPDGNAVLRHVVGMADPPPVVLVSGYAAVLESDVSGVPAWRMEKPVMPTEILGVVAKYVKKEGK